ADVLVVEIHVDEAAQLLPVHDAALDARVPGVEVGEELGEGVPVALHRLLTVGVLAEDGRDADLDGHGEGLLSEGVVWSVGARRRGVRGDAGGAGRSPGLTGRTAAGVVNRWRWRACTGRRAAAPRACCPASCRSRQGEPCGHRIDSRYADPSVVSHCG